LTFAHGRDSGANPPTHDWRRIKSVHEAMEIAHAARDDKSPRAVQFAARRAKTKDRYRNPVAAPHPETGGETVKSPHPETGRTVSPPKSVLLSISRAGGPRYPGATTTQPCAGYSSLPLELRLLAVGLTGANFGFEKIGAT
jgi:hypothetical protein